MSKLGIALQAFSLASIAAGYAPAGYYRRQGTYQRDPFKPDYLNLGRDRITQVASLGLTGAGQAAGAGAGGCVGISQTITATGTTLVTMNCTGTLTMESWGSPGGSVNGGNFAQSSLAVTTGQVWVSYNAPGTVSKSSFWCPQTVTNCSSTGIGSPCSIPAGLSTANEVCAADGVRHAATGTQAGVGTLVNKGGSGLTGSGTGGAAGPDGPGGDSVGSAGGAGDAGLGGAGGVGCNPGVSNVKGGGGAGGCGTPVNGGVPGGAGGAYGGTPGRGQGLIHSHLILPPDPENCVKVAGSGWGGGTVSMG